MKPFDGRKIIVSFRTFNCKVQGVFIFVLAILLRFVHLAQIYQSPLLSVDYVPDTLPFMIIAQKIIEGNFFYTIPMNMNVLYSFYLIPFILLFQESVLAAVVVQMAVDALSAVIIYLIGCRIFAVRAGLLAGIIYAVYAPLIWFAGTPVGESISIFLLLLSFYFLIKGIDCPGRSIYYYLAGFIGGLASLGRPNIILCFALIVGGIVLFNNRDKNNISSALRYILGIIFVLLPFALNNYYLEKSVSPYPAKGGLNFYIGNHQGARGIYELIPGTSNKPYLYMYEAQEVASRDMGRELTALEADTYWYKRGIDYITSQPLDALRLFFTKILLFMNNKELATNLDYDFCKGFSSILKYIIIPPGFLMALAIMGLILIPNDDRKIILLKLMLAGLMISTVVFFISDRYRIVSFPFVILLAAQYIFVLADYIRIRKKVMITMALPATIALMIIASLPMRIFGIKTDNPTSFAHHQYGIYLLNRNKIDKAVEEFQKAIKLNPLDPEPYGYLFSIYSKNKKYQQAPELKRRQ
jgi:4-amino-4-deoxy-L-arabinose transferase-like glycosyltransferase